MRLIRARMQNAPVFRPPDAGTTARARWQWSVSTATIAPPCLPCHNHAFGAGISARSRTFHRIEADAMSEQTNIQPQDENHLIAERREKLAAWRASGRAFPNDFSRENTAGKLDEL